MQTAKLEELLASMYLSSKERDCYFTTPQESADAYGLNIETLTQIDGMQKEKIDFFAKSLKRKRFQEIARFIPITMLHYKQSLQSNFNFYSEEWIPLGAKKHIADLISFANYLLNQNQLPSQAKDCLRFELMPWYMNFELKENVFTYRRSQMQVTIVEAWRRKGWGFKTILYQSNPNRLIHILDKSSSATNLAIRSLGIYLKLPYLSKVLEWYLPG